MSFDIDPKELSLQGAAGMQLANLIRRLAAEVGSGGASSLAGLSDVDLTGVQTGDSLSFDGSKFKPSQLLPVYGDLMLTEGDELDPDLREILESLTGPAMFVHFYAEGPAIEDGIEPDFGIVPYKATYSDRENLYTVYIAPVGYARNISVVTMKYDEDGVIRALVPDGVMPLVVTLTPTSPDYSGTHDANWSTLIDAYACGRRIICEITGMVGRFEITFGDATSLSGLFVADSVVETGAIDMYHIILKSNGTYSVSVRRW